MQLTDQKPIVVVGCHRSGTSLMSKILQELEVNMGNNLNKHDECLFFKEMNELIFDLAGATWDNPKPLIEKMADQKTLNLLADQVYKKVQNHIQTIYGNWGWKDPRNSITLPIWKLIFPNLKVVHIYRHGVDVALSIQNRELNRPKDSPYRSEKCKILVEAFEVWRCYETQIRANFAAENYSFLSLKFEHILQNSLSYLTKLAKFIEINNVHIPKISFKQDKAWVHKVQQSPEIEYLLQHPYLNEIGYKSDSIQLQ